MRKWVILVLVINLAVLAWVGLRQEPESKTPPAEVGHLKMLPEAGTTATAPASTPVTSSAASTPAAVTAENLPAEPAKTETQPDAGSTASSTPTPAQAVAPSPVAVPPANSTSAASTTSSAPAVAPVVAPSSVKPEPRRVIEPPEMKPEPTPAKSPVVKPEPVKHPDKKEPKAATSKPVTSKGKEPAVTEKPPAVRTLATTVKAKAPPVPPTENVCRMLGPNSGPRSLLLIAKQLPNAKTEVLKQEQSTGRGYKVMLAPEEGFQAAMALIEKLKRSGISSYLPPEEINSFRLQAGYFQQQKNADDLVQRLKTLGFDSSIEQNLKKNTGYSLKIDMQGDEKQLDAELNALLKKKNLRWIKINPCP